MIGMVEMRLDVERWTRPFYRGRVRSNATKKGAVAFVGQRVLLWRMTTQRQWFRDKVAVLCLHTPSFQRRHWYAHNNGKGSTIGMSDMLSWPGTGRIVCLVKIPMVRWDGFRPPKSKFPKVFLQAIRQTVMVAVRGSLLLVQLSLDFDFNITVSFLTKLVSIALI